MLMTLAKVSLVMLMMLARAIRWWTVSLLVLMMLARTVPADAHDAHFCCHE